MNDKRKSKRRENTANLNQLNDVLRGFVANPGMDWDISEFNPYLQSLLNATGWRSGCDRVNAKNLCSYFSHLLMSTVPDNSFALYYSPVNEYLTLLLPEFLMLLKC